MESCVLYDNADTDYSWTVEVKLKEMKIQWLVVHVRQFEVFWGVET